MSKSKRAIEMTKTVLVLLLALNAAFLAWRTGLFNDVFTALPVVGNIVQLVRGTTGAPEPAGTTIVEAARPMNIVITYEEGERFGVRSDLGVRNAVYDRASSIIGEALGSASTPLEVSEAQWREALSSPGVFFEYITPVCLSVLDGWLGSRMPDAPQDVLVRRVFVSFGEERSRIYFQEYDSGLYFGADTASTAGKAQELDIFSPNGAVFAFQLSIAGSENAPYMLIMPEVYHPDIRAAAAGTQEMMLERALHVFGHYIEMPPTYFSGDVLVCVGAQFTIRVYPDGRVMYRRTDGFPPANEAQASNMGEMIEHARAIIADSVGMTSGDAEVHFESIYYREGVYFVYFGYYIAGGRIHLYDDRHAAFVGFSSGIVVEAELNFRNYALTGYSTRLLPERQALAAAGGEFILSYSDLGPEILQPSWVKVWF